MILTSVGEIGVHAGQQTYVLRPSLYAVSTLGDGDEIVQVYADVMRGDPVQSLGLILACSEDDVSGVFGWSVVDGGRMRLHLLQSVNDTVRIAQALAKHGIAGDIPRTSDATYSGRFDPREFVSLAIAHLGVAERDAWQMTMTGLLLALQAKYPVQAPTGHTLEEYEAFDREFNLVH